MGRYLRILISLAALAILYAQVGGFEPEVISDEPPSPATAVTAAVEPFPIEVADGAPVSPAAMPAQERGDGLLWETVTIERGESFYIALQRAGLDHETIMGLVNACKPHTNLRRVQRGATFELAFDPQRAVQRLQFELDAEHFLVVSPGSEGRFDAQINAYPVKTSVRGVRGVIETNLFDALREQGADATLADQLADILGWDIDFFRDLRVGDEFAVVFEEFTHDGRKVRDERILAAEFTNQGKAHQAYVFENAFDLPSYYDGDGRCLEKQFLRAPLKFSRISSGFSRKRLHPVLKRYMPHYGVDYVAPTGTPVLATADGVVTKREYAKGNGKYMGIRHGQGYESFYLHLSGYAKNVHVGDRVKQGQVIGYVGSTGWATAPHLDYRIKGRDGKWLDPRKLKLPPAEPVSDARRGDFAEQRNELRELLDAIPREASAVITMHREATPTPLGVITGDVTGR